MNDRRSTWYEPRIDPNAAEYIAELREYGRSMPERVQVPDEDNGFDHSPNLIGSLVDGQYPHDSDARHMPVIDIDATPMRLVPSKTSGHFHLYIDKPITWRHYKALLHALAEAGLIEQGYYEASCRQGSTFVRFPAPDVRDDLKAMHRLNGESVGSQAGHYPSSYFDRDKRMAETNLVSGACCGDPADCGHRCGIA